MVFAKLREKNVPEGDGVNNVQKGHKTFLGSERSKVVTFPAQQSTSVNINLTQVLMEG